MIFQIFINCIKKERSLVKIKSLLLFLKTIILDLDHTILKLRLEVSVLNSLFPNPKINHLLIVQIKVLLDQDSIIQLTQRWTKVFELELKKDNFLWRTINLQAQGFMKSEPCIVKACKNYLIKNYSWSKKIWICWRVARTWSLWNPIWCRQPPNLFI